MWKVFLRFILGSTIVLAMNTAVASERSDTAWQLIHDGALIVDVRTPQEFADGHVDGAINIPLSQVNSGFKDIAKDQSIIVYCRSGNRSGQAKKALDAQGYVRVHNGGGLNEMLDSQPPLN